MRSVTRMAANPDAGRISALLRESILKGADGDKQRTLSERMPNDKWFICTVSGIPDHPLPVARHLPLLDAIVDEVERTRSEHIPFARLLLLAKQAEVQSDEVLRLCFLLTMQWQDGDSDCTCHVSAIYRYGSPQIRGKVVPMPDPELDPDFEPEMEPGIMFSRDMVELWRGRYNFRMSW